MKQKFMRGDLVKIADEMPPMMVHFPKGMLAFVCHSYYEEYGGSPESQTKKYGVVLLDPRLGPNYTAWYYEEQLTLVSKDAVNDLLRQLKWVERE